MSEKAKDPHGRWRNVTVAFRLSLEESDLLNHLVRLSGLTKQEYLARRVLQKDVVVQGNPRVYKALKTYMERVFLELQRLERDSETEPEFAELLRFIAAVYCTGTTYLRNAGKGGTGGGKCGKGPILGGFAAGRPRYKGGMSQLF